MQQVYREHPRRSVISIKYEITLRDGCSPGNLLHSFRTLISKKTSRWLVLNYYEYNKWLIIDKSINNRNVYGLHWKKYILFLLFICILNEEKWSLTLSEQRQLYKEKERMYKHFTFDQLEIKVLMRHNVLNSVQCNSWLQLNYCFYFVSKSKSRFLLLYFC